MYNIGVLVVYQSQSKIHFKANIDVSLIYQYFLKLHFFSSILVVVLDNHPFTKIQNGYS